MKHVLIATLVAACLLLAWSLFDADSQPKLDAEAIKQHWAAVRAHKEFLYNPENYKPDPATGLNMASPPDAMPSLAALVSAGELEHVDLVLPTVPRTPRATQFWIQWADGQDDVWYMEGNPQYVDYKPAGSQPLHINIWFEASAKPKVQQLIKDLERLAEEGD